MLSLLTRLLEKQKTKENEILGKEKRDSMLSLFVAMVFNRVRRTHTAIYMAISFSFFNGNTFTLVLAGLAATSIVSPGRKGFGTPFFAF